MVFDARSKGALPDYRIELCRALAIVGQHWRSCADGGRRKLPRALWVVSKGGLVPGLSSDGYHIVRNVVSGASLEALRGKCPRFGGKIKEPAEMYSRSRLLVLIAASAVLGFAAVASADCFQEQEVVARVSLLTCQGFEVQASTLMASDYDDVSPAVVDFEFDAPGESYRGLLLQLVVERIESALPAVNDRGVIAPLGDWRAGGRLVVFARSRPGFQCKPKNVQRVRTLQRCCDTLPHSGECIVPSAIPRVEVLTD